MAPKTSAGRRFLRAGLLCGTAVFVWKPAFAQSPAPPPSERAGSVADGASVVDEITVTATRQTQALSRVPVSVAAYDQAKMDTQGVRSIGETVG